jgi:glycosyltransferase involved in cell wall biosynthesis
MSFGSDPSIGFVSTFPPTVCGIASYTASLVAAIASTNPGTPTGVISLDDSSTNNRNSPVLMHHRTGNRASLRNATAVLDAYDTVSIQHEFGIWGRRDGIEVLDFMSRLTVPSAVTLHTVLREPTQNQKAITEAISGIAERVVVMSQTASTRLIELYGINPARISVIPHGADPGFAGPSLVKGNRPLILTWGLIGPGKGLEWAIRALVDIADMRPLPRYLIAGATHPHVKRDTGETYREGLMALIQSLGLGSMVDFDDRYLERQSLARLVRSADVVVLPYESAEQVTSGVLVEAIAASKPVIATRFPHAVELLASGAGAVVPYGETHVLGEKLRQVLSDQSTRDYMTSQARRLATDWYWPTVGDRFTEMMSGIVASPEPYATTGSRRQRAAV